MFKGFIWITLRIKSFQSETCKVCVCGGVIQGKSKSKSWTLGTIRQANIGIEKMKTKFQLSEFPKLFFFSL